MEPNHYCPKNERQAHTITGIAEPNHPAYNPAKTQVPVPPYPAPIIEETKLVLFVWNYASKSKVNTANTEMSKIR